jgi:hypothetical protein
MRGSAETEKKSVPIFMMKKIDNSSYHLNHHRIFSIQSAISIVHD